MITIMQPFQCDLQPQIQETHRTTHTGTTTRCRTQRRNQNDPSRNRRTHEVPFIAGRSHFRRKNTRFFCSSFLPSSPLLFVTASLPHHSPSSPPYVIACSCSVMYCSVMYSRTPAFIERIVMWCIVMWCIVAHHPSLSVLLCDVLLCDV